MSDDERIRLGKLRTMGTEDRQDAPDLPEEAPPKLREHALEVLRGEFQRVLEMKEKLGAEAAIGGKEKGRDSLRQSERLRGLIASLEGMSRFAIRMGLVTPAENRELFADAMRKGLHDGWSEGA